MNSDQRSVLDVSKGASVVNQNIVVTVCAFPEALMYLFSTCIVIEGEI